MKRQSTETHEEHVAGSTTGTWPEVKQTCNTGLVFANCSGELPLCWLALGLDENDAVLLWGSASQEMAKSSSPAGLPSSVRLHAFSDLLSVESITSTTGMSTVPIRSLDTVSCHRKSAQQTQEDISVGGAWRRQYGHVMRGGRAGTRHQSKPSVEHIGGDSIDNVVLL